MGRSDMDVIKVKLLLKEFDEKRNISWIKYDWDSGHSYSYLKSDLVSKLYELEDNVDEELWDHIQDHINAWMYDNDDCPPCAIYVNADGTSSQSCCYDCDTISKEETLEQAKELAKAGKENNTCLFYLINVENNGINLPQEIKDLLKAETCDCSLKDGVKL